MIPARTILAAVDFSDASQASLCCAPPGSPLAGAPLPRRARAESVTGGADLSIDLVGASPEQLDAFCRHGGLWDGVRADVRGGGVGRQLHLRRLAAEYRADLIVAGSRGLSGLNRSMMGTTVERLIRHARASVLTVQGDGPPMASPGGGPVVAAIEASAPRRSRWPPPRPLATSLAAPLHLVHVVPRLFGTRPVARRGRAVREPCRRGARHALCAAIRAVDGIQAANLHVARAGTWRRSAGRRSRPSHGVDAGAPAGPRRGRARARAGHGGEPRHRARHRAGVGISLARSW